MPLIFPCEGIKMCEKKYRNHWMKIYRKIAWHMWGHLFENE